MIKENENLKNLKTYQAGKSATDLKHPSNDLLKLSSNENPFGCCLNNKELMSVTENIHEYFKPDDHPLNESLAQYHAMDKKQLCFGNGSDEIFQFVAQAFLSPQDEVISANETFSIYQLVSQISGAATISIPLRDGYFDLDKIKNAITPRTKAIFIANPNNPTGTLLSHEIISSFLRSIPSSILVILDEAYREYVTQEPIELNTKLLKNFPNLLITRTFSKIYGLAALRFGYGIGSESIIQSLKKVRLPFNSNIIAVNAAHQALTKHQFVQQSIQSNKKGLDHLVSLLKKTKLKYFDSQANFLCIQSKDPSIDLFNGFLQKGIITRSLDSFGIKNAIRLTIGDSQAIDKISVYLNEFLI